MMEILIHDLYHIISATTPWSLSSLDCVSIWKGSCINLYISLQQNGFWWLSTQQYVIESHKLWHCIISADMYFKVILHQFRVKKIFPSKFNLEYGGNFTKLFMHVSSRNMFPTTRILQIHVHVYRRSQLL
jgi:hypothetical protein